MNNFDWTQLSKLSSGLPAGETTTGIRHVFCIFPQPVKSLVALPEVLPETENLLTVSGRMRFRSVRPDSPDRACYRPSARWRLILDQDI